MLSLEVNSQRGFNHQLVDHIINSSTRMVKKGSFVTNYRWGFYMLPWRINTVVVDYGPWDTILLILDI